MQKADLTAVLKNVPPGDWVALAIAEEDRATLFQRTVRRDRKRGPQGLGLGLYVAATVARLHGGSLRFEPTEPEGATFLLRLPRA